MAQVTILLKRGTYAKAVEFYKTHPMTAGEPVYILPATEESSNINAAGQDTTGNLYITDGVTPFEDLKPINPDLITSLDQPGAEGQIAAIPSSSGETELYYYSNNQWNNLFVASTIEVIKIAATTPNAAVDPEDNTKYAVTGTIAEPVVLSQDKITLEAAGAKAEEKIAVAATTTATINSLESEVNIDRTPNLENQGTTTLNSCVFHKDIDTPENGYYNILNHGILTIEDGVYSAEGEYSSLIANGYYDYATKSQDENPNPQLTINGGTFIKENFHAVKNDDGADTTINNGTFYGDILNAGQTLTINGGTYTANGPIINIARYNDNLNAAKTYINGGTYITAASSIFKIAATGEEENVIVEVRGGSFNKQVPQSFIVAGYKQQFNQETQMWEVAANV